MPISGARSGTVLAAVFAFFGFLPQANAQDTPPISTATASESSCTAAYDCNIGFVCRTGKCIDGRGAACRANDECASGDACVLGICAVPAPRSAPAEKSEVALVEPPKKCAYDKDCPGELICDASVCKEAPASCRTDRECAGEMVCERSHCVLPPKACQADRDCDGTMICEGGRCAESSPPPAISEPAVTMSIVPCKGLGRHECPDGQVCRYFRCEPPPAGSISYEPFRIGLSSLISFARGGDLDNAGTAFDLGADLAISMSKIFRFHFELAYERIDKFNGLRVAPLVLGFAIPILGDPVRLEVEILLALVQAEMLFGGGRAIGLGSGARVQVAVGWGPFYLAIAPAGLEFRYLAIHEEAAQPGFGLAQSLMFTVGYER